MMKTKLTIILAALFSALALFSCDTPLSLGEMLNLEPPVVVIETPEFMENVGGSDFKVTGTATDKEEIVKLTVTIKRVSKTGQAWEEQKWEGERGVWQGTNSDLARWDMDGKGSVSWSISVDLSGAPDGEYSITAGAVNNVQNAGALTERRVVIDNKAPAVTIIIPELEPVDNSASYNLKDPRIIKRLFNQDINIQYEVNDSFSINTLMFKLYDSTGDIIYYNEDEKLVQNPGWNGTFTIPASQIVDVNGNEIIGDNKHAMKLISIATDKAGNEERKASHGWLVYWPESDKPWTQGVGDVSDPKEFPVYPRMDVQGEAYDDDGVKQVSLQIFKNNNELVAEYEKINTPQTEGASPSTYFSWNFPAPEECNEYRIVLNCEDINGTKGTDTRYFYVMDTSGPTIDIVTPNPTEPLFGDGTGNFTISGFVGDGSATGPLKLQIVWLKEIKNQGAYQSSESTNWDGWTVGANGNAGDDGNSLGNNKRWNISSSLGTPREHDEIKDGRHYRSFSLPLNIFNDLDISASSPLIAQTFILRVESDNQKAITVFHTVVGDNKQPSLEIRTITVNPGSKVYKIVNGKLYKSTDLTTETTMDSLSIGDTVSLDGIWYDDSFEAWGKNASRLGVKDLTIDWNGTHVTPASVTPLTPLTTTEYVWTAGPLTLDGTQIAKGGGYIEASLSDWGNNITAAEFSARVGGYIPLLTSISSATTPGTYTTGNTIDIKLNLRENVTVIGVPKLNLNTSPAQTAIYTSGSGSSTLTFSYTVIDGDSANPLQISSLDLNGVTLTGSSNDLASELTTDWTANAWGTGNGKKLSDISPIVIDTLKPELETAVMSGDTLTLTFNKDIYKGTGNITLVQQGTYLAPAVLTKTEFQRYGGTGVLGAYYEVGTNGTDANGNSDLTEKYILKYSTETNDSALVAALKLQNADKVSVPVTSGAVAINGSNRKIMTINLSTASGYALQVKGVSYALSFPANFVQDAQNNPISALSGTGTTVAYAGVNTPFIRVQKDSGSIVSGGPKTKPGTPTGTIGWVKDADLVTSAPNLSGNNWQVDKFRMQFNFSPQQDGGAGFNTTAISRTKTNDNYIPNSVANFSGRLYYHNTNANTFKISWWEDNPWTLLSYNNGGTFYVNPYNSTIIYPVPAGDPPDGSWTMVGNLWVASGVTPIEQNTSPGVGYIRVFQTGAPQQAEIAVAEQPLNASVKIDCQTPDATIQYGTNSTAYAQHTGNPVSYPRTSGIPPVTVTMPAAGSNYNRGTLSDPTLPGRTSITLLNSPTASDRNGYLCGIRATASNGGATATAYEKAARSVIQFNDFNTNIGGIASLRGIATAGNKELQLWLRGGDKENGSNSTPGFPLSWDENDYNGIQLLTKDGATDNWYWITWGVTANAYTHFIAGTTDTLAQAQAEKAPLDWVYSKNAWSYLKGQYLLHPGESLTFTRNTSITQGGTPNGDYEFFGSFTGSR